MAWSPLRVPYWAAARTAGTIFSALIDNREMDVEAGADEGFALHVGEQIEERRPEALDVGDDDRFGVAAELRPGQLLDQFFQRADAARQRHERV